jgi:hypothetical protein
MPVRRYILPVLSLLSLASFAAAQEAAKPAPAKAAPDVLMFANGDQLTGKLEGVSAGNVMFESDMAGHLTISVDKVKELRSGAQFALLKKGVPVSKHNPAAEGTVTFADGNVMVHPDMPAANADSSSVAVTVPAKDVAYLVSKADFDKQVSGKHSWREGWGGSVTGGATLVRSTTTGTTLNAALNLIRALPAVAWLAPKNRTTLNVNESYGKNTSPGAIPQPDPPAKPIPAVTTLSSIFHADAERDEYFNARLFVLADTSFDHNYAQGLQLQQLYGGGIGWTAIKSAKQELDLKADIHYEKQQYINTPVNGAAANDTPSQNIIGSTIFESYTRTLPRNVVLLETANILPAFNNSNDYSANATLALSIPVFKRLSASISTTDNYLNDPQVGYKKNSYQFVTGVTYLLR